MHVPNKTGRVLSIWRIGVYLGINPQTQELIVGSAQGIHMMRSIRRRPEDQRWNVKVLMEV